MPEWYSKYDNVKCPIEESDSLLILTKKLKSHDKAKIEFNNKLEQSLEQFRRRNVICKEFGCTL